MYRTARRIGPIACLIATTALLVALAGCEEGPSMIRVHNTSTYAYSELEVGPYQIGDLAPDEYTEYLDFGTAYDYNYVRLTIDANEFVIQPVDYVGEEPLGEGFFTYELRVVSYDDRTLEIHAVGD